jgi:hypothetical protein
MGGLVTAHIAGLLPLGSQPWLMLGILTAARPGFLTNRTR